MDVIVNVLPFIFSFLIIFALVFQFASDRKQSVHVVHRGLNDTFGAMHQDLAKEAEDKYAHSCKKTEKGEVILQTKAITKSDEEGRYVRETKCVYEDQKFNLSKFEGPIITTQHPRYKAAARLLKSLYQKASFYKKGLEYTVLDALLSRKETPIIDLFKKDPELDTIMYKMVKGTSTYIVGTNRGYPSLLDYCTFKSSNDHLNYDMLSRPVLESLVGPSLMEMIEEEESKDGIPLTQMAFEKLLRSHVNTEVDINDLLSVLQFGKTTKQERTAFIDENSGMIIRK